MRGREWPLAPHEHRRAQNAFQLTLALLFKLFAWKEALVIVKPATLEIHGPQSPLERRPEAHLSIRDIESQIDALSVIVPKATESLASGRNSSERCVRCLSVAAN
jgi:hypothetical protein